MKKLLLYLSNRDRYVKGERVEERMKEKNMIPGTMIL